MVGALFDTNILIDFLHGLPATKAVLARYEHKVISLITVMEVLVGTTPNDEAAITAWLQTFDIIAPDMTIAQHAVTIRRQQKLKLPDAIILATAQTHALTLITRNTKDFPSDEVGIDVPY